ncbi:MAG: M28 family peptidase [Armatimonadetes bacterium]|nr:M28 family peptidase [Armatimonadota bacterium]
MALLACLLPVPILADPSADAAAVSEGNLRASIEHLAALPSRLPGTAGHDAALAWLEVQFRRLGLRDVQRQSFRVPVPSVRDAALTVAGQRFALEPLSPDYVRLCGLPAGGVTGPLVYGGDGSPRNYTGRTLDGAVVLLDFACGQRWLDAATLGAAALVFIEPPGMDRGEAQRKLLKVPVDVPRFYLRDRDFQVLRIAGGAAPGRPFGLGAARVESAVDWQDADAANLYGFLPGSGLERERLIVTAYYDSTSVVPRVAPGAEQAAGIATLLEAVRVLGSAPRQRSVVFVALDAHFQGLAGARKLAEVLRREFPRDKWPNAYREIVAKEQRRVAALEKALTPPAEVPLAEADRPVYQTEAQRRLDEARADLALLQKLHDGHDYVLHVALDLSSGSDRLGVFHTGHFYRDDKLTRFLSPLGKCFAGYADKAGWRGTVVDCITPLQDQGWDSWVPDQFATDAEPVTEAGRPAVSLFTISDARPLVDTPFDRPSQVNFARLVPQVRAATAVLAAAAGDAAFQATALKRVHRLPYRYEPVDGMIYEFERRKTFLPNTPVPHALVAIKNRSCAMMGVRPDIFAATDVLGNFRLVGYPNDLQLKVDAYGIEPGSGRIVYAPDMGPEGELKYPRDADGRKGLRRPLILFPCRELDLFDLVDERYFQTLQRVFVYDARSDSEPRSYGYEVPILAPTAALASNISASYVEPVAVVYAPRDKSGIYGDTPVKVTLAMGMMGLRCVLTNATKEDPEGGGFSPAERDRVVRAPYRAARDMWLIDELRMAVQKRYGIANKRLEELHVKAGACLDAADQAAETKDWEQFLAQARAGWAYEARAYPDVQGTEADTIAGVLFYLALLLPFACFSERLLFAAPRIQHQIGYTVGIFMLVYVALRLVHPAFQLLDTPWIILLGFIIMTLASMVIAIVARRFNEELEALKTATGGQHTADVSRMSTLGAAFSLGISNMRRRPLRTSLTATTLLLLTFTVLSFTSVQTSLRSNARPAKGTPVYPGMLIRDTVWSALEEPTARILQTQYGTSGTVATRAWLTSAQLDKQLKLAVRNGTAAWAKEQAAALRRAGDPAAAARLDAAAAKLPALPVVPEAAGDEKKLVPGAPILLSAVLGVTSAEARITGLGTRLRAGRWFRPGEKDVCLVPASVARKLDLGPGSSAQRAGLGFGAVEVFGSRIEVIGVVDDKLLETTNDLDGEPLTPVDFSKLEPQKLLMLKDQQAARVKNGGAAPPPIDRYEHFPPELMILLPFDRLMAAGGTLRSVAIRLDDPASVEARARELMDRFELSAYAAQGQQVFLYSSVGMLSVSGLEQVLIPLIIAALIVLNTMLGSVVERLGEIGIFSSIGLAPAHISMLFLAESCVFANLGVIIGYLLGQTLAKALFWAQTHHYAAGLAGLSLNYSSTAAVGVAVVIIATVLLSTLYPSRKAARMATPDVERRWRLPIPDGHVMTFSLPFMLTGRDGIACNTFLKEYFDGYVDFAGGDFYTDGTSLTRLPESHGFRLALTVWLAPYDLGVSQRVELTTLPDPDDPHVHAVSIRLERISGDDNGWRRTNWLFINILRRQFLIWRTIAPAQKAVYAESGEALLAEPESAGD